MRWAASGRLARRGAPQPPAAAFIALAVVVSAVLADDDPNVVFSPSLFSGLDYRMVGPHRGGRVTAVAGVLQDRHTFYMGATGGGVWKTTNLGQTWENVSDPFFATPSIGAIDVADSDPNVVYVGTGSACIRSNVVTGRGIYGSTDAGRSWTFLGLREAGAIGDVVVHPTDPDTVYVAAVGHPFGPNEERGVFRSLDGGLHWEKVLYLSEQTGAVDLAMDPTNPRILFAAMWRAERKPWTILSGGDRSGLYRSADGGETWTKVEEGLPRGLVGKIAVDVAASNPQRVYALVEADGEERGLYRSDDGGESFTFVNGQKSLTYRPWYYTHLTIDPKNDNRVYVNNESFWLSLDGGKAFEARPTPHGDNHALWIHPEDPDLMVQGNDGGANVSIDGGRTWSPQWNQPTAELYQVEVDSRFPYRLYGAQQDNSTISVPSKISRQPIDPKQDWWAVSGCETGPVVPHPDDPDVVYGGCKGRHSVWDRRTGQTREYWVYPHFNYGHDTREMPYRFQRTAPMILSPHDSGVIYHASHVLHRSRDEGRTWEAISPDLTRNDLETQMVSGGPITRDITGEEVYSAIYAVAESPHREGVIWVGSNDGPIHVTRDGGESWKEITPVDLPAGGRVNRIDPSPHVEGRAWVAVYRFQLDDWRPYAYRADDWGERWTLLTDGGNGIPADTPVRVVREDPDREGLLYAGTEFGMYVSFDGGAHWQSLQLDLPAVPISDVKIHRRDLVLSTMGRSFWILDNLTPLHQLSDEVAQAEAWLFEPRDAYRARWVGSLERRFAGYAPEYPPTGAQIDYYLTGGATSVQLEILDQSGRVVRTLSGEPAEGGVGAETSGPSLPVDLGMHRAVWDLRHEPVPPGEEGEPEVAGPMAVPGSYTVRVTAELGEGESVETWQADRDLRLLIDPRVAAAGITPQDLEAQLDLQQGVRDAVGELRSALRRSRSIRLQIEEVMQRVRAGSLPPELRDEVEAAAAAVTEAVRPIEEALRQVEQGKVGLELEPQLEGQLLYLYGMISGADQRPGRDAYLRFEDVRSELDAFLDRLRDVESKELAAFNTLLRTRLVPAILLPAG